MAEHPKTASIPSIPDLPPLPPDTCPRCGGPFRCGIGGPGPCACTRIRLDDATLASLRQQFVGCLCLDCLAELSAAPGGTITRSPGPEPR